MRTRIQPASTTRSGSNPATTSASRASYSARASPGCRPDVDGGHPGGVGALQGEHVGPVRDDGHDIGRRCGRRRRRRGRPAGSNRCRRPARRAARRRLVTGGGDGRDHGPNLATPSAPAVERERKVRCRRTARCPASSSPITQVGSAIAPWTASTSSGAHIDDHADAHVERAVQLVGRHRRHQLADESEQRWHRPRAELDRRVDVVGQHARQVLGQAAAGDVGQRLDAAAGERRRRARRGTSGAARAASRRAAGRTRRA